ncbi:NAD(P)-binding protein [Streptomyces sp. NPDC006733]|uniref:NAD(P)/FAD-dependent oxidoreductase n=1 Tax=Streptomyces sp. NPDC006733 TaxID=3155460 RepID=UPI0033FA8E96
MSRERGTQKAIVLGAGFSGLLATHILSKHGYQVALLDPDPIRNAPAYRHGTPQARHPHSLLQRGATTLDHLLPGLLDQLVEQGAPVYDFGQDARVLFPRGWAQAGFSGVRLYGVSRPLLESAVRRRVLAHPGARPVEQVRGVGLLWRSGRVAGVRSSDGYDRPADLVVDASGRASRLGHWLEAADLRPPHPKRVSARLSYTSRLYTLPDGYAPDWRISVELTYAPDRRCGGVAARVENDQILVTLIGADGERAPRDEQGFRDYAARLRNPHLLDVITHARPIGATYRCGGLNNHWNPYHRMPHWPNGLLALGDAVCTLNPIYGHGMTVAALEAEILDQLLAKGTGLGNLERRFQRAAVSAIRVPWQLAAYSDTGWQPGHRISLPVIAHHAVRSIVDRIPDHPVLYQRFIAVQNLLAHPATLARPTAPHQGPRASLRRQTLHPSPDGPRPLPGGAENRE